MKQFTQFLYVNHELKIWSSELAKNSEQISSVGTAEKAELMMKKCKK